MTDNKASVFFNAKLKGFEKLNDNFLKAKCYILALGKNQNMSYFCKENVDRAYPSLAYTPVVGHLMTDENGNHYLGGHDVKLDLSTLTLKSQCVPFGVTLPSETPIYEEVVEADGSTATYLVSDVVIWSGRYPEVAEAIYDENTYFGQSMEILFSKAEKLKEDTRYTDIIDFSFDALCMLNKSDDPKFNVEPCFPSSSFKPITYSLDKNEFSSLMNEMKEQLSFCLNNKETNQGGNTLDKKTEVLQKYGKTVDDLDFSIEDITIEDLTQKMEELFGVKQENASFSATYRQKRDALSNALDPIVIRDEKGNLLSETYYWIEDFSDEYVFVEKSFWSKENNETKYGRFVYTFDETNLTATISGEFEEMVKVWLTLEEKTKLDEERASYEANKNEYKLLQEEFFTYKVDHSFLNTDYSALESYKSEKEKELRIADESALFSKYEKSIGNTKEFSELKKNSSKYSITDLKKELIYLFGLNKISEVDETESKPINFSVEKSEKNDEPIESVYKKYLNK